MNYWSVCRGFCKLLKVILQIQDFAKTLETCRKIFLNDRRLAKMMEKGEYLLNNYSIWKHSQLHDFIWKIIQNIGSQANVGSNMFCQVSYGQQKSSNRVWKHNGSENHLALRQKWSKIISYYPNKHLNSTNKPNIAKNRQDASQEKVQYLKWYRSFRK